MACHHSTALARSARLPRSGLLVNCTNRAEKAIFHVCWTCALFLSDSLPHRDGIGTLPEWEWIDASSGVTVLYFRRGARCYFKGTSMGRDERGDRGRIMDQSVASRLRAAWTFLAAECTWLAMTTLTWRFNPEEGFFHPTRAEVERAFDYMRRKFRARWGEPVDAWIMEMHRSGVPHIHLFHAAESAFGMYIRKHAHLELIERRGVPRQIVRGGADHWMVDAWLRATRRGDDEATQRKQRGGIIELFDSPQGAARYVAKEAAKRYQKELPAEYPDGLGQWWWLNPRWKPRVRAIQTSSLHEWPYEHPASYVFDAEEIASDLVGEKKIVEATHPNLATWESWARM